MMYQDKLLKKLFNGNWWYRQGGPLKNYLFFGITKVKKGSNDKKCLENVCLTLSCIIMDCSAQFFGGLKYAIEQCPALPSHLI